MQYTEPVAGVNGQMVPGRHLSWLAGADGSQRNSEEKKAAKRVDPLTAIGVVPAQEGEHSRQEDEGKHAIEVMKIAADRAPAFKVKNQADNGLNDKKGLANDHRSQIGAIHALFLNGADDAPEAEQEKKEPDSVGEKIVQFESKQVHKSSFRDSNIFGDQQSVRNRLPISNCTRSCFSFILRVTTIHGMVTSYREAMDYLYTYANFEHKRIDQYTPDKIDPSRPARLLALLGDPHRRYPALHIAGTKGKGSVAALCAAVLRAAGLKTGLYTSPHLVDFRERFRVLTPADGDGRISEALFAELVEELRSVVDRVPGLTWFELVTAVGFLFFAREAVDVAVVEVGLGGRLDATNVITPLVSVITSLSLDHTELLGNTLAEIAGEKGGIIKPGVPVVTAPQAPEALARLQQIATEQHSPLVLVGRDYLFEVLASGPTGQTIRVLTPLAPAGGPARPLQPRTLTIPLAGAHQQENAVVALAALDVARSRFPALRDEAVAQGMANASWPGRLQLLDPPPGAGGRPWAPILLDSAHNPHSAQVLAQTLPATYAYRRLWLVLGITADKNVAGILEQLLPLADVAFVTRSSHPRAAEPEMLRQVAAEAGYRVTPYLTLMEAVTAALERAGPEDLICVTGSIFVVGDLLNRWDSLKSGLVNDG
jgi:dihydrofolate synthase / folylpolyglutamate synthase